MTYRLMLVAVVVATAVGCGKTDDVEPTAKVPIVLSVNSETGTRAGEKLDDTDTPDNSGYTDDDFTAFTNGSIAVWAATYTPAVAGTTEFSSNFFMRNVRFNYYTGNKFASSSSDAYWRQVGGVKHNFYFYTPVLPTTDGNVNFQVNEDGIVMEGAAEFAYGRVMGVTFNQSNPDLKVYLIPQFAKLKVDFNIPADIESGVSVKGVRFKTNSSADFNLFAGSWNLGGASTWVTRKLLTAADRTIAIFPNTEQKTDTPVEATLQQLQVNVNNIWYEVDNITTSDSGSVIPFTPGFTTTLTVSISLPSLTQRDNWVVTFDNWSIGGTIEGELN